MLVVVPVILLLAGACMWIIVLTTPETPPAPPQRNVAPAPVSAMPATPAETPLPEAAPPASEPSPVSPLMEALLQQPGPPETGRTVRGIVVDQNGAPVAGAAVYVNRIVVPGGTHADAETDPSGSFSLQPPEQDPLEFTVVHPEYAAESLRLAREEALARQIRIVLSGGGGVVGTVRVGGHAIPEVEITLGPAGPVFKRAVTDAHGNYELRGVPPGTYTLFARWKPGAPGAIERHANLTVEVIQGRTVAADFSLPAGLGRVAGVVRLDGVPADTVTLSGALLLDDGSTETILSQASPGTYLLDGLPSGMLNLVVTLGTGQHSMTRTAQIAIEAGNTVQQDFDFFPGNAIVGQVRGIRPGEDAAVLAIEGYHELAEWSLPALLGLAAQSVRSAPVVEGGYVLRDLTPGAYTLLAYTRTGGLTESEAGLEAIRADLIYVELSPGGAQQVDFDLQ
jgi:hypothetical protein